MSMKKLLVTFLTAAAAIGAWADDPEVVFDFVSESGFAQCTQLHFKGNGNWQVSVNSYAPQYSSVSNSMYGNSEFDDVLISPALQLQGGNKYSVRFTPFLNSSYYTEKTNVKVFYGTGDDFESYSLLGTVENVTDYNYGGTEHEFEFILEEAKDIHVAVEAYGHCTKLEGLRVYNYGSSDVPKAPADFKLTPDPDGALKVNISFTMPGTTLTGQTLTNPTYTLYRGVEKVKDHQAATPGQKVVIEEDVAMSGKVIYSLEIHCGDQVSEKLSAETYVGKDTATPPTNVTVKMVDGKFLVSWEPPVYGEKGTELVSEKLKYCLVRYVDGEEASYVADITGTSSTDEFSFTGLHKVKYGVGAKYGDAKKYSAECMSNEITIGSIELPFQDSFADVSMDNRWENVVTGCTAASPVSYYYWEPKANSNLPNAEPYDNDGGMLRYNSYMLQVGNSCRLSTPPISYHAGDNVVVSFARFQGKNYGPDTFKLQISSDYGEWVDVPDAQYFSGGADEDGWIVENVVIADCIPAGTKVYQVAFYAEAQYQRNIYIDAVRIFNSVEKDLAIEAFTVSETAHAGKTLDVMVKVTNYGSTAVAASDYTVEIEHDFTDDIEITDLVAIPSLSSVIYNVSIPVHSLHLFNANSFEFIAKVNLTGDQLPANNSSESVVSQVAYGSGDGVEILESAVDADGNITVKWVPAKDLDYEPVNISESFEDEEWEENFTGPFNGWVTIDIDGKDGGTWYTAGGSQFNLAKNVNTPGNTKDGNNVLGLTVASNAQQDDWIISPKVNCKKGSVMNIDFLFGMKYITSSSNTYVIEILYTTGDSYDILNPADSFSEKVAERTFVYSAYSGAVPMDNKMYRIEFEDIPCDAKYVAIHFAALGSYTPAMWVDDIHLYEKDVNPLQGYHIYSLATAGRINEEMLSAESTEFTFKPEAGAQSVIRRAQANFSNDPCVFVSAVYPDGEAKPKNVWNYAENTTGIENVAVDGADEAEAEYFNLQGMKIRGENLTPGIYIIRSNGASRKVYVK